MATLSNFTHYTAALAVIKERLDRERGSGGTLEAMKWNDLPEMQQQGKDDLPCLGFFGLAFEEQDAPGANSGHNNSPITPISTLQIAVVARREYGLFQFDPTDASTGKAFADWLPLIMDAIETRADGTKDACLDGTLARPLTFSVSEDVVSNLAWAVFLEVRMEFIGIVRGTRSDGFVAPG